MADQTRASCYVQKEDECHAGGEEILLSTARTIPTEHRVMPPWQNGIPESSRGHLTIWLFAEYALINLHVAAYAVVVFLRDRYLKTSTIRVGIMARLCVMVKWRALAHRAHIRNCKELESPKCRSSVLHSRRKFIAKDGKIRFGLLAIKNVGSSIVDAIMKEARRGRDIDTPYDFIKSILNHQELNDKKAIECLIAGAMDEFTQAALRYKTGCRRRQPREARRFL